MSDQLKTFLENPSLAKLGLLLASIVILWVVIKLLQKLLFSKFSDHDKILRANKGSKVAGYFFTLILVLIIYSNSLGGFTVALGVAGAGIAFALQEVIGSFAGWLAIMFGGFYKTGDRVQLGGIKGDVMDIGMLRTTIMEIGQWIDGDLYNGRIVLIANSFVFKEPVFNYSGEFPFLWDEIKIPITYGSNYDKTKIILLEVGRKVAGDLSKTSREKWKHLQHKFILEDSQTDPLVTLVANDNWVEFTLRYIVGYRKRRTTQSELFTAILKEIENTNGEIKFASSTLQIINYPESKNN
ncbi:mechanosensitive ion channel [soil metagenome]